MSSRMLSPSAINTFKQCPRKFYYQYILRIKTVENIHLVRGSIVHDILERIYDLDVQGVRFETARLFFGAWLLKELKKAWADSSTKFREIGVSGDQAIFYFQETRMMLRQWLDHFLSRLRDQGDDLEEAFKALKPLREKKLISQQHRVLGFVDVIEMIDEKVVKVVDYKTSAKDKITNEYELQLAVYALLIYETYGHFPEEVAIHFLRHGERSMKVDQEMLDFAKREIAWVLERIQSEDINEYPKKVTPLCKWENARGSGQCDFYDRCFKQQVL